MARTILPAYDGPIVRTVEEVREEVREWWQQTYGDYDVATEEEASVIYGAKIDVLEALLMFIEGIEPESEVTE